MLPSLITDVEKEFPPVALQVCRRMYKIYEEITEEEGDPPDTHQHLDPMPYDYNLSVRDSKGLVIRHNFH